MNTILLDRTTWDLVIDASGDIAMAREPYSLAQDAASEIKTFQGECWYDTLVGIPYWIKILGKFNVPLQLIKSYMIAAAQLVPDVASAQVFLTSFQRRVFAGQVQITSVSGESATAQIIQLAENVPNEGQLDFSNPNNSGLIPTIMTGI